MTRLRIRAPPSWRSPWTVPVITLRTGSTLAGRSAAMDETVELFSPEENGDQAFLID